MSASGAPPAATSAGATGDDEFESFGAPMGGATVTFGGGGGGGGLRKTSFGDDALGGDALGGDALGGDALGGDALGGDALGGDALGDDGFDNGGFGGGSSGGSSSGGGFGSAARLGRTSSSSRRGGGPSSSRGDDPFSSGGGDVDFGALLGSVGEPAASDDDPFGLPAGGGSDDLFGPRGGDASYGRRGADDGDPLFHDDDEDSLFLATANTSGAMFDDDDHHDHDGGDHTETAHASDVDREPASQARSGRASVGDDARPKRDLGRLLDRVLIGSLIVLTGGLIAEYQGIPAFGLADLLPSFGGPSSEELEAARRKTRLRPIPQNLADPTDIRDTVHTYQLEIARLTKVREVRPNDPQILADTISSYLDLWERAPAAFHSDVAYAKELSALLKARKVPSLRYDIVRLLTQGELLGLEKKIDALVDQPGATADDLGSAAWALWRFDQAQVLQDALDNPGHISDPAVDPLLRTQLGSARLKRARALASQALTMAKDANNRLKFVMIKARIDDGTGFHEENMEALRNFAPTAKDAIEAQLLLAAGLIRSNLLGQAAVTLKGLTIWAADNGDNQTLRLAHLYEAWLAHKRGRIDEQIVALGAALRLDPDDELTTVRLGRMLLGEKRSQECYKLLSAAKKRGLKSIAFEVALVEYWLWAHRNDDALAEIKEATKNFPESVDLLYLRGQVEEQEHHTATARDFYGKVISREPKHLRAALRLATLQSKAGRHDDALSTLTHARERIGALESILELMATELLVLNRTAEARAIYAELLKRHPSHKMYLLNAARMDVKAGHIDSALKFLLVLRSEGALDREGAQQLAMALASKGKPAEAASTLVKFADREPNDIRLNALSGQYMLDSGNIERAETLLNRAFRVAHRQGGDAETLFQYGRLAFRKGEISKGVSRMRQAIKAAPQAHHYRYVFAKALLLPENLKWPSAGAMAVTELKWLIAYANRLETKGNRIDYLADVYRTLARYFFDTKQFAKAIPLLRKSLALEPDHLSTRVRLGNALFRVSDPRAEQVLRDVLKRQPNNYLGALYLGLTLQNRGRISEAITWLTHATKGSDRQLAEAWYQLAMIYRDRGQTPSVIRCLREFLRLSDPKEPFRPDAVNLLSKLAS